MLQRLFTFLPLFYLSLTLADAQAQTRDFQTDRPDFTEGSQSLEKGFAQIESGITWAFDSRRTMTSVTLPELLVRIGAFEDGEIRFATTGYSRAPQLGEEKDATNIGDLELGGKWSFFRKDEGPPPFAIIASVNLPTGRGEETSTIAYPIIKFVWDAPLSETIGLAGNINVITPFQGRDSTWEAQASIVTGTSITDSFGVYAEYFGLMPQQIGTRDDEHYLSVGCTYMPIPNLQLDLRGGTGLTAPSDDVFLGTGLSVRF